MLHLARAMPTGAASVIASARPTVSCSLKRERILNRGDLHMLRHCLGFAAGVAMLASSGLAQAPAAGPYKVLKTIKVGGAGAYDYVQADVEGRRLYIARTGPSPRMTVYNLDTLEPVGEIPTTNLHGAAIDPKTNHGFATSKPITMFDTKTLQVIKTIDVQGN